MKQLEQQQKKIDQRRHCILHNSQQGSSKFLTSHPQQRSPLEFKQKQAVSNFGHAHERYYYDFTTVQKMNEVLDGHYIDIFLQFTDLRVTINLCNIELLEYSAKCSFASDGMFTSPPPPNLIYRISACYSNRNTRA